jgi:multiple antibiotic resistance protein
MNAELISFFVKLAQAVTALLIVLNPLGLVPVIASVTAHLEPKGQRRLIRQVALIGSGLLLVFTFAGTVILAIFGITPDDLRVAGGLLLLSIAFNFVLKGSMSGDAKFQQNPSAAPIASPILVGPGAITTAVVLVKTNGELVTAIAVAIATLVTWLVFLSTPRVYAIIKESGADIIVRIMGILLAAIAVVYIRNGIFGLIHMMK